MDIPKADGAHRKTTLTIRRGASSVGASYSKFLRGEIALARIESFDIVQSFQNDQSGSLPNFSWLGRTAKRWPVHEMRLFRRDFLKLLGQGADVAGDWSCSGGGGGGLRAVSVDCFFNVNRIFETTNHDFNFTMPSTCYRDRTDAHDSLEKRLVDLQ